MSLAAAAPPRPAASLDSVLRAAGWTGLGLIAVAVSLSDFLASAPADAVAVGPLLTPPSEIWRFGTDILGRDLLSETLHGLSATVRTALPATVVTLLAGALFGFAAARLPRALALGLRGTVGILASVPTLLLAILIIGLTARGWAASRRDWRRRPSPSCAPSSVPNRKAARRIRNMPAPRESRRRHCCAATWSTSSPIRSCPARRGRWRR
ncbi:MAG: hypothetical protein WDN03_05545 [Rhizomicrobium sp.]